MSSLSVKSMDCMRYSFEMIRAVDCVLLPVLSEGILTEETDTGILLTLDTDTGRFDVIPDEKLFLMLYMLIKVHPHSLALLMHLEY